MEAIRVLAGEIGPRPPCSEGEHRAARWCAGRLEAMGLRVELEAFESRPSVAPILCRYLALSAAAAVVLVPLPLVAFVAAVAALVLYAREVDGRPLVPPRGGTSVNVVARRDAAVGPSLVVVANLDSGRPALRFSPRFAPGPRGWAVGLHLALVAVPVVAAIAWVTESTQALPPHLWLVAVGFGAVLAAAGAAEWSSSKSAALDGANDNASGVAALLAVADRFAGSDVWWVLLGSGHAGNVGMQRFLEMHAHELGEARILNLTGVGSGELTAPREEGLLRSRRGDAPLMDAAVEAGAEMGPLRTVQTAAAVSLARARPALSIAGLDERGSIAHQGGASDTVADVDPATFARAVELVARVVEVFTGHRDARRPFVDGSESS
ncbi:MAG TPA: hypothetical protein VIG64_07035 [Actinomycetota bacterium]|jgi:hypothetical protein